MYKKIIISTSLVATLFLSGCGSQSPSDTILSEINTKNITGEKNISNLLFDYYKRAKNNVHKPNCSSLSTSSDNKFDNSIIELSTQYCNKDSELESKMKDILNKVNQAKSMDIKFEQIDGTSLYMDKGYSLEQAKILNKANIDLNTLSDFENLYYSKDRVVFLVKHNINYQEAKKMKDTFKYLMDFSDIQKWLDAGLTIQDMDNWKNARLRRANTMSKRLNIIKKTGIKDPKEWEQWENNRVYSASSFQAWKDAGIKNLKDIEYVQNMYIRKAEDLKNILSTGMKFKDIKAWFELGMHQDDAAQLFKILKEHNYADLKNFEKFNGLHIYFFGDIYSALRYRSMNEKVWNEFLAKKKNLESTISKVGGVETINKWKLSPEEVLKMKEYGFTFKDFNDNHLQNKLRLVHDLMRNNVSIDNIIKASKIRSLDSNGLTVLLKTEKYKDFDKALNFLEKVKLNTSKINDYKKANLLTENDVNTLEGIKFNTKLLSSFQDKTGLKSSQDIKNFFLKNNIDTSDIIRFERLKFNTKGQQEYKKELLTWAKMMHRYKVKGYRNTAALVRLNADFMFNTKDIDFLLQKGVITKRHLDDYYSNQKFFREMKKVLEYDIGKKLHINSKIKQKEKFMLYVKSGAHSISSVMMKAHREAKKKR